jgi:hypothetical protein
VAGTIKTVKQYRVLDDPDWTTHDAFHLWNYIELTVGIIAASSPSLKPLFHWALQTVSTVSSSGKSKGSAVHSGSAGAPSLDFQNMGLDNQGIQMQSNNGEEKAQGGSRRPDSIQATS